MMIDLHKKSKDTEQNMGVSKNNATPKSQIIHFNRVFHYFHHPFWELVIPLFLVQHPYRNLSDEFPWDSRGSKGVDENLSSFPPKKNGFLGAIQIRGYSTNPPPGPRTPPRNKGVIFGLIKGNQWVFISP